MEQKIIYTAIDGKTFDNKSACIAYEQSITPNKIKCEYIDNDSWHYSGWKCPSDAYWLVCSDLKSNHSCNDHLKVFLDKTKPNTVIFLKH